MQLFRLILSNYENFFSYNSKGYYLINAQLGSNKTLSDEESSSKHFKTFRKESVKYFHLDSARILFICSSFFLLFFSFSSLLSLFSFTLFSSLLFSFLLYFTNLHFISSSTPPSILFISSTPLSILFIYSTPPSILFIYSTPPSILLFSFDFVLLTGLTMYL